MIDVTIKQNVSSRKVDGRRSSCSIGLLARSNFPRKEKLVGLKWDHQAHSDWESSISYVVC